MTKTARLSPRISAGLKNRFDTIQDKRGLTQEQLIEAGLDCLENEPAIPSSLLRLIEQASEKGIDVERLIQKAIEKPAQSGSDSLAQYRDMSYQELSKVDTTAKGFGELRCEKLVQLIIESNLEHYGKENQDEFLLKIGSTLLNNIGKINMKAVKSWLDDPKNAQLVAEHHEQVGLSNQNNPSYNRKKDRTPAQILGLEDEK